MIENSGRTGGKVGRRGTAFYIEVLILVGVFTIVVMVLTRIFVRSGQLGMDAALLTDAVHLAENGAEAVAASRSLEEVESLLEENGNGEILAPSTMEDFEDTDGNDWQEAGGHTLRMHYDDDLNPVWDGTIWMDIYWIPEMSGEAFEGTPGEAGLVKSVITVNRIGRKEPIYTLETEVFIGGD